MEQRGAKRYRVLGMQWDSRATALELPIDQNWDPEVRAGWYEANEGIVNSIEREYGQLDLDRKLRDFKEIGPLPFSIIAFHNDFFGRLVMPS
jgi:hypothetical protein